MPAEARILTTGICPEVFWFDHVTRGSRYDAVFRVFFMDKHRALTHIIEKRHAVGRDLDDEEVIQALLDLGEPVRHTLAESASEKEQENEDQGGFSGAGGVPGGQDRDCVAEAPALAEADGGTGDPHGGTGGSVREVPPRDGEPDEPVDLDRDLGPPPAGWEDWGDW